MALLASLPVIARLAGDVEIMAQNLPVGTTHISLHVDRSAWLVDTGGDITRASLDLSEDGIAWIPDYLVFTARQTAGNTVEASFKRRLHAVSAAGWQARAKLTLLSAVTTGLQVQVDP